MIKKMKQNQLKKGMWLFCAGVLFFTSCIDGFKDENIWTSDVQNVTLGPPSVDDIKFAPAPDGSKVTVTWPVVLGAGGYSFSLYIVDDPANPRAVGEENQVIDGCSAERPMVEDTYYKVVIKTLGNPKYNNKEAETPAEKVWNNMLTVTAVIPSGTNLSEYFTTNPIPISTEELCYELEGGGSYTMNASVNVGLTTVTFRGNKVNHPKITVTDGSFVSGGGGLRLKWMDVDYSGFAGDVSGSVISMATIDPAAPLSEGGYVILTAPIAIQSCEITGLKYYLFRDAGQKYAVGSLLFEDCIIGRDANQNAAEIRFQTGMLKDLVIKNSTFFSKAVSGDNRLIQISSGSVSSVKADGWLNGSMTITNTTFYQVCKTSDSFNSNGAMRQSGDKVIIKNCIFVDSFNQAAIRRFRSSSNAPGFEGGYNSYWFNGIFPVNERDHAQGDNSGTHIETDPQLKDPANGDFTVQGSVQIAARTGDPRWLPAQ
jgi:hypothetical protein